MIKELCQEARREAPHLAGISRPHRRRLRDDQPLDESPGEAMTFQPISE
jgi:hypothetical protein